MTIRRAFVASLLIGTLDAGAQQLRFHAGEADRVRDVPRDSVRNANGSVRVVRESDYAVVRQWIVPLAERWSRDERLRVAPGFLIALLLKESAGDSLAVSAVPALGLAQLTVAADSDLRLMVTEWHFQWMRPEVDAWPRSPRLHAGAPSAAIVDSLLRAGAVGARDEYLFDPERAARAAVFWVRLLENKWTTDFWPGGYGSFARARLNGGGALTESQLIDLVTVCYNRGYLRVHALVARHGPAWTDHLDELGADGAEAHDYLERVRAYTALFQASPVADTSSR